MIPLKYIKWCGVINLLCAAWNLFGDLYYLDFYTSHLSEDEMAMIRDSLRSGYLFDFSGGGKTWLIFLAQSGGWMYPVWAFVTAVLVFNGLQPTDGARRQDSNLQIIPRTIGPCLLMVYGLCIIGGALHQSVAFVTVLPSIYHDTTRYDWSSLSSDKSFSQFLAVSQNRTVQHIAFGTFPGYIACNVASIWAGWLVQFRQTILPRRFNFFNPLVTMIWIQILGGLLPDPWGFYIVGSLGTWGLMIFNSGMTYFLWKAGNETSPQAKMLLSTENSVRESSTDYQTVSNDAFPSTPRRIMD